MSDAILLIDAIEKYAKETERLAKEVTMYDELLCNRNNEVERLHSIIKEAREEIRILVTNSDIADYQAQKLFQILDKVEENK